LISFEKQSNTKQSNRRCFDEYQPLLLNFVDKNLNFMTSREVMKERTSCLEKIRQEILII
jgi:hypothetical protein